MGQVRVFSFTGNTKNTLNTKTYTDASPLKFIITPEIKIFIEDWQNCSVGTQNEIKALLAGWIEGTE